MEPYPKTDTQKAFDAYEKARREQDDQVYRGYRVRYLPIHDHWTVSKNGFHVYAASSLESAKESIDELTKE